MLGYIVHTILGHLKVFAIAAAIVAFIGWFALEKRAAYNRGADKVENKYTIAALREEKKISDATALALVKSERNNAEIGRQYSSAVSQIKRLTENREETQDIKQAHDQCRTDLANEKARTACTLSDKFPFPEIDQ